MNETTTTTDPRLPRVQELLYDLLGWGNSPKEILPEHRLVEDLGADSLDEVEIVMMFEEEYDLEIPDEDVEYNIETVQQILEYLNKRLGPAEPTNGVLDLTDDQFIDRYRPERAEDDSYYRQRDWDDAADIEAIEEATKQRRIWTAQDDDNGRFCITSGKHYVNRHYYIITSRPLENEDWHVQIYDPEDAPVYILCTVHWDLDGADPEADGPPMEVVVNLRDVLGLGENEVTEENSSEIADWLSDTHGFCVKSFNYKSITEEEAAAHE